jgi:uncharacterized protein
VFGIDIRYAMGATLVSVIATSSGAAAAFVREGFTNIRIGMFLEIATPVARVAFSVVAFALERDRLYVGITLVVLAVLLFGLAGGHL